MRDTAPLSLIEIYRSIFTSFVIMIFRGVYQDINTFIYLYAILIKYAILYIILIIQCRYIYLLYCIIVKLIN